MPLIYDYYAAQDTIEELLRKELIGPVAKDEILSEPPLGVYSLGILWAQRTTTEKTKLYEGASEAAMEEFAAQHTDFNTDIDAIDDLDDLLENPNGQINAANVYRPSAMAISMVVGGQEKSLTVRFKCATYSHHSEETFYEKKTKDKNGVESVEIKKRTVNKYTRKAIDCGDIIFDLKSQKAVDPTNIPNNIDIKLFIRKTYPNGSSLVTVSVQNKLKAQNIEVIQNTSALFQGHLSVVSKDGFLPITENIGENNDLETQTLNMLYRETYNFATGHGCSVKWQVENDAVYKIESEFMPVAELFQMEPRDMPNLHCFHMGFWNSNARKHGCDELDDFILQYQSWLSVQKQKGKRIGSFTDAINYSFANIENCIERLRQGVKVLRSNDIAWKSFLYMNEAMLMQRINYAKRKGIVIDPSSVTWYPFQIAYILQIIPDVVDNKGEWRNTVDLLWFPTGERVIIVMGAVNVMKPRVSGTLNKYILCIA